MAKTKKDGADDLSGILARIQKDMSGAAVISSITTVPNPYALRRPTGILSLDEALNGGWPAATICQIFGPDGTGKDFLANCTLAQNQLKYGEKSNVFWMSFGYKPDLQFMRMCGVQLAFTDEELREQGIDPEKATAEDRGHTVGNILFIDTAGDVKSAREKPAEILLTAVLKLTATNKFQIGVVNELGSGETGDNVKKGLDEDAKMATFASLMSDWCRKYYTTMRLPDPAGNQNETTILMINPVRANLDTNSAKYFPHVQGSGYALKHAKVIDLHIGNAGYIRQQKDGVKRKIGKTIKWKIMKGKHGISEGAEGHYDFYFNKGVDLVADVVNAAKAAGALRRGGRYYYILDDEERIEGGLAGVLEHVRANPGAVARLRKAVIEGVGCVSADDSDRE